MSIRKCGGHRCLCLEPSLERIESRQLPSAIITMLPFLSGHLPPIHAHAAGTSGGGTTTPMGQPTPHELRREAFSARYQGTYTIGPGRFTDQAEQIFFIGAGILGVPALILCIVLARVTREPEGVPAEPL